MADRVLADAAVTPESRTADTADGGWTVESHSASTVPTPLDTTAAASAAEPVEEIAATAASASDDAMAADAFLATGDMPRAEPGTPAKKKPKQTFQARIDELTGQRRNVERELDTERTTRLALEARIAALERPVQPAAVATPQAKAAVVSEDAMPEPPKYIDFETDDAYNAAVGQWRTDTLTWQTARETRLKTEITGSLDQRLTQAREQSEAQAREQEVVTRLRAVHVTHPDFAEVVAASGDVLAEVKSPFLHDMITNTADGGELLYDLASDTDMALALGALPLPTRPLADAVRSSPAMRSMLKHFATPDGRQDFERLRLLHPVTVIREVGKLEARLEAADRGSAPVALHPITNAVPPAKPPVGSPRARVATSGEPLNFDDWMEQENARERTAKLQRSGVALTH